MYKQKIAGFISLITVAISIPTFADPFSFSNTPQPSAAGSGSKNLTVVSPEDFKKNVKTKAQQNLNTYEEQLKNSLAKQKQSDLPPPPKMDMPSSINTAGQSNAGSSGSVNTKQQAPAQQPVAPNTDAMSADDYTDAPVSAPVATPAQQKPVQNQNYTGFGSGSSPQQSGAGSSSGSGWGVKY